jgi:hypothetical protein
MLRRIQTLAPRIPTTLTVSAGRLIRHLLPQLRSAGVNVRRGLGPPALGPDSLTAPSSTTGEKTQPAISLDHPDSPC